VRSCLSILSISRMSSISSISSCKTGRLLPPGRLRLLTVLGGTPRISVSVASGPTRRSRVSRISDASCNVAPSQGTAQSTRTEISPVAGWQECPPATESRAPGLPRKGRLPDIPAHFVPAGLPDRSDRMQPLDPYAFAPSTHSTIHHRINRDSRRLNGRLTE
jgi:hypothetical protein